MPNNFYRIPLNTGRRSWTLKKASQSPQNACVRFFGCSRVLSAAFTISLGVLSSVLYDLWSLGAPVRAWACTHEVDIWVQDFGLPENSQSQTALSGKSCPKGLHFSNKTRCHPKSSKLQGQMPDADPSAKQEHNPAHQQTACPEQYQAHRQPKTRYWTQHWLSERQDPALSTRIQTQVPPMSIVQNALVQPYLLGANPTN